MTEDEMAGWHPLLLLPPIPPSIRVFSNESMLHMRWPKYWSGVPLPSPPGSPVHHQLPELTQTHVHQVSDATQPSHPLSSPSPPAFNFSQHQGLFNELALDIRWSKYWSINFSISPSSDYLGLISLRIDWLDLLAVQGTVKSLL